jgi:MoxR-like ATPase
MNEAFLDRFARKVAMLTPGRETLAKIIRTRTGLEQDAAIILADLIRTSEQMAKSGKLSTHLSLRPVLAFARDVAADLPLGACMESTILSALPATEAQAMRQHVLAQLDLTVLRYAAHPGLAPVVPPAPVSPEGQAAQNDFANV